MSIPSRPSSRRTRSRRAVGWLALTGAIACIVFAAWMSSTGRHALADLAVPVNYTGDALGVLAQIRAYQTGELAPFVLKEVAHLGAPFGANWTDYPNEDLVYFVAGMFARLFGLFAGTNLFLVSVQVAAGIAFLVAGRALGYRTSACFAAAVLYALAPYAFERTLDHLSLTNYWHVPLMLFAIVWATGRLAPGSPASSSRAHAALAMTAAACAGFLNPYYLAMFGWLTGLAWIGAAARRDRAAFGRTSGLLAIAVVAFVLQSADTVWMNAVHGSNASAFGRDLRGLDQFGMRLPDLAFPHIHRWAALQDWSLRTYHAVAPGGGLERGEAMRAYMGVFAVGALAVLLVSGTIRLAARQYEKVSQWFWPALAVIAFSVVGGLDYLLGAFGFVLLRGTNRFSIVLAAIALLWLCERLSSVPRGVRLLVVAAMLLVGPFDQVPRPGVVVPTAAGWRPIVESDARFVRQLESAVRPGSMVLELPIKEYPESGHILKMADYEHFRPYLHSTGLRFSYGSLKGRGDTAWQSQLATLPVPEMLSRVGTYGFEVVYVNRNAYPEKGAALMAELHGALGDPVAQSDDLVAYRLQPKGGELPPSAPGAAFNGFSYVEQSGGHVWAWATREEASIEFARPYRGISRPPQDNRAAELRFIVESINAGGVVVSLDGRVVDRLPAGQWGKDVRVELPAGRSRWRVDFASDRPPVSPGGDDPRKLSFRARDWEMVEAPPARP